MPKKAKSKTARKPSRKPSAKTRRWTPARLSKLAPETPRQASRDDLLARIRSLLTVPDTPEAKARRS